MDHKKTFYENQAKTILKGLEKRQITGFYCEDVKSAKEKVLSLMPEGASIGWGGSMTLLETGILDAVKNGGYQVFDRDSAKTPEEAKAIFKEIGVCDYFLMSTNAITIDGELVNVDGRSNRVSYLCYGPEHVIIVAGMNKVVANVEEGISRTHNQAAPPNAVRLNRNTPCAVTGKCGDCFSPDCICSNTVITRRSSVPGRIIVVLVGEALGY